MTELQLKGFEKKLGELEDVVDTLQHHILDKNDPKGRVMKLESLVQDLQIHIKEQDDTVTLLKWALESGHGLGENMKIIMKES